jgi:hypothetical protein
MDVRPELSVVVAVVEGESGLKRCLKGLSEQVDPPSMEILVPLDDSISDAEALVDEYPGVRVIDMGAVTTRSDMRHEGGRHELYARRRAAGLEAARGTVVALLEDRVVPRPEWSRTVVDAHHGDHGRGVIGGAVENGVDRLLHWAVYFCDYGRYQLPFAAGAREYATDVNVSYTRAALAATKDLWLDGYEETAVNWALSREGRRPYLVPDVVVDQIRGAMRLSDLLAERFRWGWAFSAGRSAQLRWPSRFARAILAPVLPPLMWIRLFRQRVERRRGLRRFLEATPAVILLLAAWAAGEAVGYLRGLP